MQEPNQQLLLAIAESKQMAENKRREEERELRKALFLSRAERKVAIPFVERQREEEEQESAFRTSKRPKTDASLSFVCSEPITDEKVESVIGLSSDYPLVKNTWKRVLGTLSKVGRPFSDFKESEINKLLGYLQLADEEKKYWTLKRIRSLCPEQCNILVESGDRQDRQYQCLSQEELNRLYSQQLQEQMADVAQVFAAEPTLEEELKQSRVAAYQAKEQEEEQEEESISEEEEEEEEENVYFGLAERVNDIIDRKKEELQDLQLPSLSLAGEKEVPADSEETRREILMFLKEQTPDENSLVKGIEVLFEKYPVQNTDLILDRALKMIKDFETKAEDGKKQQPRFIQQETEVSAKMKREEDGSMGLDQIRYILFNSQDPAINVVWRSPFDGQALEIRHILGKEYEIIGTEESVTITDEHITFPFSLVEAERDWFNLKKIPKQQKRFFLSLKQDIKNKFFPTTIIRSLSQEEEEKVASFDFISPEHEDQAGTFKLNRDEDTIEIEDAEDDDEIDAGIDWIFSLSASIPESKEAKAKKTRAQETISRLSQIAAEAAADREEEEEEEEEPQVENLEWISPLNMEKIALIPSRENKEVLELYDPRTKGRTPRLVFDTRERNLWFVDDVGNRDSLELKRGEYTLTPTKDDYYIFQLRYKFYEFTPVGSRTVAFGPRIIPIKGNFIASAREEKSRHREIQRSITTAREEIKRAQERKANLERMSRVQREFEDQTQLIRLQLNEIIRKKGDFKVEYRSPFRGVPSTFVPDPDALIDQEEGKQKTVYRLSVRGKIDPNVRIVYTDPDDVLEVWIGNNAIRLSGEMFTLADQEDRSKTVTHAILTLHFRLLTQGLQPLLNQRLTPDDLMFVRALEAPLADTNQSLLIYPEFLESVKETGPAR